jgi:hypothetical protein
MELDPALVRQLDQLSAVLDDGTDLGAVLEVVVRRVRRAVPSVTGLQITVVSGGTPIFVSSVSEGAESVRASLRLPLRLMAIAPPGVELVLVADARGAFDTLAPVLRVGLRWDETVIVDDDLAPNAGPVRSDTDPAAMVDQAVGVLFQHGYTPAQAQELIWCDAVETGQTLVQAAEGLIAAHTPSLAG